LFGRDANADTVPSTTRSYGNTWHYLHRRQVSHQREKPQGQLRQMQPGKRCGLSSEDRWRKGRSRVRRKQGWLGAERDDIHRYIGRFDNRESNVSLTCWLHIPLPRDADFPFPSLSFLHPSRQMSSASSAAFLLWSILAVVVCNPRLETLRHSAYSPSCPNRSSRTVSRLPHATSLEL